MNIRKSALYSLLMLATACIKEELPEPIGTQILHRAEGVLAEVENYEKLSSQEVSTALSQRQREVGLLNWNDISLNVLTNAVKQSGGVVMIGYKPTAMSESALKAGLHLQQMESAPWVNARKELYQMISNSLSTGFVAVDVSKLIRHEDPRFPFVALELSDFETLKTLRESSLVRYIEPVNNIWDWDWDFLSDAICGELEDPNTNIWPEDTSSILPNAVIPWNYEAIQIPQAWEVSAKGEGITVGIIDTGVPANALLHPAGFTSGWSGGRTVRHILTLPDGVMEDECGHGTKMAGTLAGPRNSVGATSGVAYKSSLNIYKGVEDVWINTLDEQVGVATALYHAANNGVRVMSMSLGSPVVIGALSDAIQAVTNQGLIVVSAAGTSPPPFSAAWVAFPANMQETIAVTGVVAGQNEQVRCDWCHAGPEVDFTVPMQRADDADRLSLTFRPSSNLPQYVGGSSIATATVAGVVAMILSQDPSQSKEDVYERLQLSASFPLGKVGDYGHGTINAYEAVRETCDNLFPNGDFEKGILFDHPGYERVNTFDMTGYRKLTVDTSFAAWAAFPGCIPEIGSGNKLMVKGTNYESNTAYFLKSALNETVHSGEYYQISFDFSGGVWEPILEQYNNNNPSFTLEFYSQDHDYSQIFHFSADRCNSNFVSETVYINYYGATEYDRVRLLTDNASYGSIFQLDNLSICHVE